MYFTVVFTQINSIYTEQCTIPSFFEVLWGGSNHSLKDIWLHFNTIFITWWGVFCVGRYESWYSLRRENEIRNTFLGFEPGTFRMLARCSCHWSTGPTAEEQRPEYSTGQRTWPIPADLLSHSWLHCLWYGGDPLWIELRTWGGNVLVQLIPAGSQHYSVNFFLSPKPISIFFLCYTCTRST